MKLFWTLSVFLSAEVLLEGLAVRAEPLQKTSQQADTTLLPVNLDIGAREETSNPISQQAADLVLLNSESEQQGISDSGRRGVRDSSEAYISHNVSLDRVSLQTNLAVAAEEIEGKSSSNTTPPSLPPQVPTQPSKPIEIEPSFIPVEFVLPSPAESFKISPDFSIEPSSFSQDKVRLEDVQFSVEASELVLKANAQYKRIPQIIAKERLPPFFTAVPLNGTLVSHLTEGEFSTGYKFGNGVNENFLIGGLYAVKSQIKQSISRDNIFTSDQTGLYVQLKTVPKRREITITRIDPQTVNGLQFQLSFTGSCSAAGRFNVPDPNAQCSLTPALTSDRSSIDPDTLQTTRIFQAGSFGDVVSPETLRILAQPGFQSIGADEQVVGLDLFFPNTGAFEGNAQGNRSALNRFEDLSNTYTLGLYRVRQVYKSNAKKAVLGRTLHGVTEILFDRNFPANTLIQGAAQLLPDVVPKLKGDPDRSAVTNLNQSLIFSANNTRLPERSFVIYQAGYGESKHPQRSQKQEPGAVFNSLWLGLSPVADRVFSIASRYAVLAPSRITSAVGAEGGAGTTGTPLSVLSLVNLDNTVRAIASSNLSNYYTQGYFTFFETDVNRITTSKLVESVTYYPHISLTGNTTEPNRVIRYYGGFIASPVPKAYLGVDYSHDLQKDLRLSTSLIGYVNPDRDYFSKAESRIEKVFRFSPSSSLSLFGSFRYVFDRIKDAGNGLYSNPVDNFVSVGLTGRIGPFSAGITQFFDVLPSSVPNGTGINLSVDLAGRGSLSGYFVPQRGVTNYGILASLKLNPTPNAPTLSFSWNRATFDFGSDAFNNALNATEDKFQVLFSFGSPSNPFKAKA
ncbi:hypothetical protein [Altericista sp. CCNU0014]|uniref:hypothetical protein n=1 Tax=Altericista sp. CCNU0014 TaxID=3082949 RepID=UPI00384BAE09